MTRYEYPIINVDVENEHFELSDSVIAWMENCRVSKHDDPKEMLASMIPPEELAYHHLSPRGMAWNLVRIFGQTQGIQDKQQEEEQQQETLASSSSSSSLVKMRGDDEWAPPRGQIIFIIHEETNFRKSMQKQNYRCSGCGLKIDLELARRLVLYCHYFGKYFCKCCFSHKAIHLPGYILQKWDFHKYPVSHFALQLLNNIANEPLFNIDDINQSLYKKVKKLKSLIDIRSQLYYLRIYISTCQQTDLLNNEFESFAQQHLLEHEVHLYSLNNLIEIQHGKLHEYLNDLVTRSIAHIAQCDRCRAKGHYCQLCGPSSLMSSMISSASGQPQQQLQQQTSSSSSPSQDHELIFPFEIGRVAQCNACGCCFHLQCFLDAGQHCPKCERIQRRKAEDSPTNLASTTTTAAENRLSKQLLSEAHRESQSPPPASVAAMSAS